MKQELMDAILETPVIAAVKDDAGLRNALTNENIRVVFVLYGDICNISSIVRRIHEAGRFAVVHVDLIAGLAGKEVAVDFIRNTTEADGIISTRQSFIRRAKELGLAAILRVFLLDSIALESLDKIPANLPDCLDLLPGAMPKILRRVCAKAKVPVLTGGLIADKEDVLAALADIRVPIYAVNARQVENNCAMVSLTIGINNTEHLNRVVARLSKVKDVLKVTRS